jgi:lipopolysaccharide export LptBFGC system permease protein LptF
LFADNDDGEIQLCQKCGAIPAKGFINKPVHRAGGENVKLELQNKLAYPVLSLVMALVALPFAFRLGRQGALYGVGISLILGIVLVVFFASFTTLGEIGILPPMAAVWSPSLVFALASIYLFLGVRS